MQTHKKHDFIHQLKLVRPILLEIMSNLAYAAA